MLFNNISAFLCKAFANGKKYVGEWKNNKLNGYAIKYYADGRIYQKGIFKDGVFVE